jgi:hypothetical protein
MVVLVTWMSSASVTRELSRDALILLETHIVMSLLIFHLILLLMLHLISFMDLTITHIVLVHEGVALCLDALVMAHVLIVVIVPPHWHEFPTGGSYTRFEPKTWMVHIFPGVVHILLIQMVRCKRL